LVTALFTWLLLLSQISCSHSREEGWKRLYSDVRLQLERGNFEAALAGADRGLRESSRDQLWNWKFRVLKAEILLWQTDSSAIIRLLTPPPPPGLSDKEIIVRATAIKGLAHGYLRHDHEAEALLQDAADEAVKAAPDYLCQVIQYQGYYAWKAEKYEEARQRFTESLQLAQQSKQPFVEVGALAGLGVISIILSRYDEGIERSFSALDLARASQYHFAEEIALANLAWGYQELGDVETALSYYSQQEKVLDSLGNEQIKQAVLSNMGDIYLDLGDYAKARMAYSKALSIAQEMKRLGRAEEDARIVAALSALATIDLEEDNLEEAEKINNQALDLNAHFARGLLISARIAEARHHLKAARYRLYGIANNKGKNNKDKESFDSQFVRWDAQGELAKISASEHRNDADDQFAKLIMAVEDFRRSVRVTEHRLAFSSHAQRYYDDYIHFLMRSGQPRKAFQVAEFSRARTLEEGVGLNAPSEPYQVSIERIQTALRQKKKIILSYWIAPVQSYVWLLSSSEFRPITLEPGHRIEQEAKSYNDTLLGREDVEKSEQQGQSLYELLVKPIEKFIPEKAKVVIIPDRELDKLNFETLRVSAPTPHYWIQDVETEIASSTAMLLRSRKIQPHHERRLLLIGNPQEASSDYPVLMHAGEEMQKVKEHFAAANETIISGPQATPGVYASSNPERFDVIHFVTHGTGSELSPLDSAIILSPDSRHSFKLYARDIVKTRLNADIVTISACYGAGTRAYAGEGLVGLAWAFLQAGAHRVVAGLWDVDEVASLDLMNNFYEGVQGGQSPSEALRSAKLKMIEPTSRYRRPLYWAAFQVFMGS